MTPFPLTDGRRIADIWALEPIADQKRVLSNTRRRIEELVAENKPDCPVLNFLLGFEDQLTQSLKELVQ